MIGRGFRQRCGELTRKLTENPFFPLLFIGEAVKAASFHVFTGEPGVDTVLTAGGMAVVSLIGWLYSYEDVAWGLYEVVDDE
jgi:hypothetical protein